MTDVKKSVWRTEKVRRYLLVAAFFFATIGVWDGAVRVFEVPTYILPTPDETLSSIINDLKSKMVWRQSWVTAYESLWGFIIGCATGFILGILIAESRTIEAMIYPYIVAFQTLPKVAVAPLIVIWFGFGITSKVLIAATVVFFPLLVNVVVGLKSADQETLDLMKALSSSRWQVFKMVKLPNALPIIFAGLEVAIIFCVIGAVVGEFVGSKEGLGHLIIIRNFNMDVAGVFSCLILLGVMGFILQQIVRQAYHKLVHWVEVAPVRGV